MYYGADYGMYHSIYENFHWMKTVVDPTFEYHKVMAQLQGFVATRLANADLLPLDYATEATYWRLAYLDLQQSNQMKFQEALNLIDQWEQEAKHLLNDEKILLNGPNKKSGAQISELNRKIYQIARDFYRAEGLPGEPTEKNIFAGSASTLSGIRQYLEEGKLSEAELESKKYLTALQKRVQSLQAVRKQIQ